MFFEKALALADAGNFRTMVLSAFWPMYFLSPSEPRAHLNRICFVGEDGVCEVEADDASYQRRVDQAFAALAFRLSRIKAAGVDVVILLPFPFSIDDIPRELAKRTFLGLAVDGLTSINREAFEIASAGITRRLRTLATEVRARVIDPVHYLCDSARCRTIDERCDPLYLDSNHFRASAVKSDRFSFLDRILDAPPGSSPAVDIARPR
jgi:hypothetical protein